MKKIMTNFIYIITIFSLFTIFLYCSPPVEPEIEYDENFISNVNEKSAKTFSCDDNEDTLKSKEIISLTSGNSSIYIGYRQVLSINQDPIVAKFTNGKQDWCRIDYETTGDDSKGYGLLWDGGDTLYGVFSSTGTQGDKSEDFRRFSEDGWLSSYGQGGGAKVSIIAKMNSKNGAVEKATFISALLSNGNSNSLVITDLDIDRDGFLVVKADSWFSPRNVDKTAMECSGSSPFAYSLVLTPDLTKAKSANAVNCK